MHPFGSGVAVVGVGLVCAASCAVAGNDDGGGNGVGGGATVASVGSVGGMSAPTGGNDATDAGSGGGPAMPECPYQGMPIDPVKLGFAACPATACSSGGHCVPTALIQQQAANELDKLADCDAMSKCVPDAFIASEGKFILPTCASIFGAEGRCVSVCLPDVQKQINTLPQSACAADERCAPCYNPLNLQPTGVCNLSCDPGPKNPPEPLPKCCNGIGTCVPASAVPPDKAKDLGDCPNLVDSKCVPDVFLNDPNYQPASCQDTLLAQLFGDEYAPGVCLPGCLPALSKGLASLFVSQGSCQSGFKCAPCYKPGLFGPQKSGAPGCP